MIATADDVMKSIADIADPERAAALQRYFKTGPGGYGAGDVFLGLRVPSVRKIAKQFADLPLAEIDRLLDSEIHEHRSAGLGILVLQFQRASGGRSRDDERRERIADFYLVAVRRQRVNNWDLVDSSAPYILGAFLYDRPRDVLFTFAASKSLWERRVAIISTLGFIKRGDASTTLEIAALLLNDKHDLIHKAVGWALREVGARIDPRLLRSFLDVHAPSMPRIMLSYATEHFDSAQREHYRGLRSVPKSGALPSHGRAVGASNQ